MVDTEKQCKMVTEGSGRSISASIIYGYIGLCSSGMMRTWIRTGLSCQGTVADRVDENNLPEIHRKNVSAMILMPIPLQPQHAAAENLQPSVDKLLV